MRTFLSHSNIQIIVFDLHGTLTNRASIHPYHIQYRDKYIDQRVRTVKSNPTPLDTDQIFKLYPELDKYEFYKERDSDPGFDFSKIHTRNEQLIKCLTDLQRDYILVMQSDSSQEQIRKTLHAIGLNTVFDLILARDVTPNAHNSIPSVTPFISTRFEIPVHCICKIGDRMDKDVFPYISSGANAIWVESEAEVFGALSNLKTLRNHHAVA